jgi:carbon storage regulator
MPGLLLTRKEGERVMIGRDIVVQVCDIAGGKVRLLFTAPDSVPIYREEIYVNIHKDDKGTTK